MWLQWIEVRMARKVLGHDNLHCHSIYCFLGFVVVVVVLAPPLRPGGTQLWGGSRIPLSTK